MTITIERKTGFIRINDRWNMFNDGVVYDTLHAQDIPQWIFQFRDFILEHYDDMKHQIEL